VGSTLIVSSIPFYLVALLAWIYLSLQLQDLPGNGVLPDHETTGEDDLVDDAAVAGDRADNCTPVARFTRGQMVETPQPRTKSARPRRRGCAPTGWRFMHAPAEPAIVPVNHDLLV
jgi:peptide/nickel transport system permease protein